MTDQTPVTPRRAKETPQWRAAVNLALALLIALLFVEPTNRAAGDCGSRTHMWCLGLEGVALSFCLTVGAHFTQQPVDPYSALLTRRRHHLLPSSSCLPADRSACLCATCERAAGPCQTDRTMDLGPLPPSFPCVRVFATAGGGNHCSIPREGALRQEKARSRHRCNAIPHSRAADGSETAVAAARSSLLSGGPSRSPCARSSRSSTQSPSRSPPAEASASPARCGPFSSLRTSGASARRGSARRAARRPPLHATNRSAAAVGARSPSEPCPSSFLHLLTARWQLYPNGSLAVGRPRFSISPHRVVRDRRRAAPRGNLHSARRRSPQGVGPMRRCPVKRRVLSCDAARALHGDGLLAPADVFPRLVVVVVFSIAGRAGSDQHGRFRHLCERRHRPRCSRHDRELSRGEPRHRATPDRRACCSSRRSHGAAAGVWETVI